MCGIGNWKGLVLLIYLVQNGHSYMIGNNPHHLRENIDPSGRYQLEWLVDHKNKMITFNVTVHTTGYVGFGLSSNGKMTGADIVIGGVDSKGKSYFSDYHAVGNQIPVLDPSQDWNLLSARENGSHTFLTFSRQFDTCDPQDYPVTEDKISVIWAYGSRDVVRYHYQNRGEFQVYLLSPDYSPELRTNPKTGGREAVGRPDMKVWSIENNIDLPAQDTMYWCTMHRAPSLSRKHHVVGFDARLRSADTVRHVHHLLIHKCIPPRDISARAMFERWVGHRGQQCFMVKAPTGPMPTEYCTEFHHVWVVGSRPFFIPPQVGTPFGEDPEEYYIVQVHLDNPTLRENIRLDMALDIYYTPILREHDGGMMIIRHESPGLTPSLFFPPQSLDHQIRGICGGECSRRIFPKEGITAYGVLLHTHNHGRRMRFQHFRNNRELQPIASDDNYNFFYQQVRNIPRLVKILPGDQLVAHCEYDTTASNRTVTGGFSTQQEMCSMAIYFYNKIYEYQQCSSQIESIEDRRYFLAGVGNVTWSYAHLEFIVDKPHPLAGMPVSQVSDNHVEWTLERREELQRFHLFHSHVNRCPREMYAMNEGVVLSNGRAENMQDPGVIVDYPYEAVPLPPEKRCAKKVVTS